jgi:hypothetical protein
MIFTLLTTGARAELIYGLTTAGQLFKFDSATPGTQTNIGVLSGLLPGHTAVGMDFRPAPGELFVVSCNTASTNGQLYTVNLSTAALTFAGSDFSFSSPAASPHYGFDFNPTVDRIRLTRSDGANLRLNPVTGGLAAIDTSTTWDASSGFGGTSIIMGLAYANNFNGATTTTLYGYEYNTDRLVTLGSVNQTVSANSGLTFNVGLSGISTVSMDYDMDISGASGIAYAAVNNNLYTANTNTGAFSLMGSITGKTVLDIAVPPPQKGELVYGLTTNGVLFSFQSQTPGIVKTIGPITGLALGQIGVGMDFRPATLELFLLGYNDATGAGQLYTVNLSNAVLSAIGSGFSFASTTIGARFGFDFNPTVDRIRVTRNDGANLRLNPATGGLAATDAATTWDASSGFVGTATVVGLAYANNFNGTTNTTLYGYEYFHDRLVTIGGLNSTPSSNGGVTYNVGPSGIVATTEDYDLDISGASGIPYAVVNNTFYKVNTNTGTFTSVGSLSGLSVQDIAVFPVSITQVALVNGATPKSDVAVTFMSAVGQRYNLQRVTNIGDPWADVVVGITGLSGITQVTNVNGALTSHRFYRVYLQP